MENACSSSLPKVFCHQHGAISMIDKNTLKVMYSDSHVGSGCSFVDFAVFAITKGKGKLWEGLGCFLEGFLMIWAVFGRLRRVKKLKENRIGSNTI